MTPQILVVHLQSFSGQQDVRSPVAAAVMYALNHDIVSGDFLPDA